MDDWIVIAPTRRKLRQAVRMVNQTLNTLLVEKHPAKTFIGRAEKGVDFLGYFITPNSLRPSQKTLLKCLERMEQLKEQGADEQRIDQYVKNWLKWVNAGIGEA